MSMNMRFQRFLRLQERFDQIRYHLTHLNSRSLSCSFSTSGPQSSLNGSVPDEHHVLDELSKLLPVTCITSVPNIVKNKNSVNEVGGRTVDAFLLPEEKLRGLFLQKLRGKTAIENALTSVDVDLCLDIVSKVVDRGNLSGEMMVTFFNWAIRQPNVPKDVHSYNVILRALGRRKFFKHVMEVMHEMGTQGVNPNLETLTIVMDSFVRAHYVHRAVKLFENLEEFGMKCDTESFNVLLRCLCQRSHVGVASSVLNAKKGRIPFDNSTYNIMLSGWSKLDEADEMEKTEREMVAGGFHPDCSTFSYLIEGLGRAGRIDDAIEIFDQIRDKGFVHTTSVYNAMISNFISVGNLDESISYYRRMLDGECEPNLDTYAKLVSAFLKVRKVADALEIFEEMLSRGIVPTTGMITSFLERLCSYGPPHAAMMIYKKARKVGCKISLSAYKLLLMRLSRFGKCGMLLSIWDEMQESGYSCDLEVYEYIINGLCNIGHLDNAVLVMEEALHKGFCPSRIIYSKLNNKLLASNKTEMAYKLFLKIKDARLHDNARRFWRANGWHF